MTTKSHPLFLYILLFFQACISVSSTEAATPHFSQLNRSSFPAGFVFGAGSVAYQSEGAALIDGKGPSVWDTFTHRHPEKIPNGSNGDVADDMYHRYKEDILLMKNIGLDAFRFSISWSRILPKGKISGGVNLLGVEFYNNLIDELLAHGIQPFVTLFHWDLPQALEDEYGGFLSPKIVNDYRNYVNFCFKTFGDRVKHWFTMTEPYVYCLSGYTNGGFPPNRCSNYIRNCSLGNSAIEPYIVAHHLILSHAAGVKLYREKYKPSQKGQIGITLVTNWFVPLSQSSENQMAAQRATDFMLGWFLHPITYGDYPQIMKSLVKERLPQFSESQSKTLQRSYDFLGMNYYTAFYASDAMLINRVNLSMLTDNQANLTSVNNGIHIGQPSDLSWLNIYPEGIRSLVLYIKDKYGNAPIYICENGIGQSDNDTLPLPIKEALNDTKRILYHHDHLSYLSKAIKEGANVKGYFLWSFLDDFEWLNGYTVRFGINYVDFKDGLKRYPKRSAFWLQNFLRKN